MSHARLEALILSCTHPWEADGLPWLCPRRVAERGELVGVARGEVELECLDDEVLALGLTLEQCFTVHFLRPILIREIS